MMSLVDQSLDSIYLSMLDLHLSQLTYPQFYELLNCFRCLYLFIVGLELDCRHPELPNSLAGEQMIEH